MAVKQIWRCIICGAEAADRPPRHCPTCGTPASRWRLVVDRPPRAAAEAPRPGTEDFPTGTVEISEASVS